MANVFSDEYLPDEVRSAIHDFALDARQLLIAEARDLLEGTYGLLASGALEPPQNLPALQDSETRETYHLLAAFLVDEVGAGLTRPEAVEKLVKEIAFTHLNRFVAFKMMETRKIIRETVGRGPDSNGFKFYLAEHADEEGLWKTGKIEIAYTHFLLWQAGQIAREIHSLFDPENLPSRLFPRSATLNHLLGLINEPKLSTAWQAEESIGWTYQFFNEQEKAEVFDRLFKQKKKVRRQDIPSATQLFTPRWIVRFLVENTLGRMWVQMHPDSCFRDALSYLVPLVDNDQENHQYPLRPIREISLLDPACGTMHFGLVAFDLLVEMYREEITHAGQPGWPDRPSVETEAEIPATIIKHNLFGIDIDLRSVQLSALTLYLKAKSLNKLAQIDDHNLACADVLPFEGQRLGLFIREMQFKPIYERLLRKLWEKLEDINQIGSLLRLESEIQSLIKEEQKKFDQEGRQLDLFRDVTALYESEAAKAEYWEILADQIIQALDHFAQTSATTGKDQRFFTQEATKGLRLLELMLRRYDCVVANPPYMSRRNMNDTLANFLSEAYPDAKGDLYAAFIVRCAELAAENGRIGMITQQSFMFISSYEQLRNGLLGEFAIETMAHTGPHAFAEISGEKVNTTAFVLRRESDPARRTNSVGTYFRLVHEPDADSKRRAFEKTLAEIRQPTRE
ncbi:MAG: N-6 DNA methylase [Anaerolineaceae bacterium]|nr:N-6 DNA methylase [Anaerolineaceae bacterium]